MQGELPYSLWKVSSRYFHLNREKEREKQTGAFTDEEYVPAHTHSWSAALWGCVWGNEIVTDKQKVSRFFYYYYYFLHSRDVREFLAVWALKGEKKIQKEKKKKKIKPSSLHRAQQSTSCSHPYLGWKELAQVPPFLVFPPISSPPTPPPQKTRSSSLVSPPDIPFFPVAIFSARHLLSDNLRRRHKTSK